MSITIAPITSIEECREIEWLQAEIWESTQLEVAPDHLVWTIAKEGGVVLLARNEKGEPIGFAYGIVALTADKHLKLASHQAGVLAAYHDQNIGHQLKLAQREIALQSGFDLITWTFDPLQGRNARFNLRKLGAVATSYLRDLYGRMRDELNQGLPSDRFKVEWWLSTEHVLKRITGSSPERWLPAPICPVINPARLVNGLLTPPDSYNLSETNLCLVEIPDDIQYLKEAVPELALQWRLHTRQVFEALFEQSYTAIDLLRREGRNYYLFQKDWKKH